MDAYSVRSRTKFIQMGLHMIVLLQLTSYLWPPDTQITDVKPCYDFIIVGCGTAGSILANRLSESGEYQVLVIEAGGDPPIESLYPGTYTYLPNSKYDWNFTAVDDGYTAQARIHHMLQLTSGKMLGGSSSLGHLLYVRGNPHGYNNWGEIVNDESWAFNDLLNFFKKSEKLDYKDIVYPGNDYYHGTNGPLGVTRIVNHISQKYLNLFKDLGHAVLTDGNGNKSLGYFEPMFMTKDRVRQSASYAFLTPTKTRKNLHLLKEAEVIKINFNNLIAYSVTAIKNDKKITFKATREIIVAAGAIKTAHLLMLSGIGLNEHLDANGIPVKNDLPVGKYYQDHLGVFLVHKFNITSLKSPPIVNPYEVPVNMIIGNVAVDKRKFNPEYQTVNYIIPSDSNSLLSLCSLDNTFANEVCNSLYRETKGYETMVSIIVLLHPKSRGHVALQNNDYRKPPIIISGFYSDEDDLKNMTNYILDFLQIAKTSMFKKYGGSLVLPKLRGCEIYTGVPYWKCYSLNMMVTRHHYSSTCAMGKVVDKNLKVIGVSGLRVVDASVIPLLPSGSIQAAVMAIAEKGSDMILSDAKRLYPPKCKT